MMKTIDRSYKENLTAKCWFFSLPFLLVTLRHLQQTFVVDDPFKEADLIVLSEDSEDEAHPAANRGVSRLSLAEKAIIVEECLEGMSFRQLDKMLLCRHSCIARFYAK
eukprot:scaffold7295_cov171-Ochromonas_danica.AAC.2